MLELDDASARETDGFKSMIYRLTGLDAEFTFVRLAATEGLTIERVVKGTIGPFFMPGTNHPRGLAPLFESHDAASPGEGPLVATFGLDMAAHDVARDGDNDPLEDLLTEQLSEKGREGYAQARQRHGYHVFKDRKIVVSSEELVAPVQQFCASLRARNVIYVLR